MGFSIIFGNLLGLGLEPKELGVMQVCLRGLIVFIATLITVRLAHKRFLAKMSAFDTVLAFILASALARAINGSAPFFPTLAMGVFLVLLHRILSALSYYSETIGNWVKGKPDVLVQAGQPMETAMRRHKITQEDLLEEARLNGEVEDLKAIRVATLERSGEVSIIKSSG